MTRNLKALGFALIAVLAVSGVAQAQTPHLVAGAHGTVTGEEHNGVHELTIVANGRAIRCNAVHFEGDLATTQTSLTIDWIEQEECSTTPVLGISFPITVTYNGCDYEFNDFAHTPPDFTANMDIECPEGSQIVFHFYSNSTHTNNVCTTSIPETTNLTGTTITNGAGSPDDLTIHHAVTFSMQGQGGFPCGSGAQSVQLTGTTTLRAFDTAGIQVNLTAATG